MSWSISERIAQAALSRMHTGHLELVGRRGERASLGSASKGPSATVEIRTPAAARRAIAGGAMGLAEGYIEGDWDSPDLEAVLQLGVENLPEVPKSRTNARTPLARAWHHLRDNSLEGSRENIRYHYDLGNEFYRLWLDETMTYSSALYRSDNETLPDAQRNKWDMLLDLLQPTSKDHLLEIGCGWGGFALHAAKEAGCRVTGLTLSDEQHAWAGRAAEEAGLDGLVDIRLQDYRLVPDRFTGVASIEMFEAVGERWWPVYFQRISDLLGRGRAAAIQVITIDDRRFEDYRRHPDFIQRYIFPGGMLPSPERFAEAARASGMTVNEPYFFGESYARTLDEWTRDFEVALPQVREIGFDERFIRMWRYYLAYCKAGFSAGTVDVMQVRVDT